MKNFRKALAELIGTFILVFIGTGSAVLAGTKIGNVGIALAFGLTIIAAAYSIGIVSGAHLTPAVSVVMFINKRLSAITLVWYVIAQVIGGFLVTAVLKIIAVDKGATGFGANVLNHISAGTGFLVEAVFTFIFVLVIVTVTSNTKGNAKLAGLVIGLTLTMVHLVGIPLTGLSVNPARSIAPAVFTGDVAFEQLWIFILAPLVGGILAALVGKYLLDTEGK